MPNFTTDYKVRVGGWGEGVIIGSCPWQMTDATPSGKVWIAKLGETGKIVSTPKEGLEKS